jgi:adenine-specific DNA methylase
MFRWIEKQGLGRKEDPIRLLSRQVIYHLILKVMLYELVRNQFALPLISPISVRDMQRLFGVAYHRTGLDAFKISLLDDLIRDFDGELSKELSDVADGVETIGANRADLIGRVYEDIIPGEERRKLGEYYTPKDIAEFMTRWAVRAKTDAVLDPACGSGTFLVESFYRLTEIGCTPAEAMESLCGIDINPLAGLMSTVNLVARMTSCRPDIRIDDFLLSSSNKSKKSQCIVCNPPYSRHHELSRHYKEQIGRQIDSESGRRMSRLSSIYIHFFIHAASYLENGGRMAFITPSEILDVDYAVKLKQFILDNLTLSAIVLYPEQDLIFPGTLTTACITLSEKKRASPEHQVVFVKVSRPPEIRELLDVIEAAQRRNLSWARIELIPQSDLKPEDKWSQISPTIQDMRTLVPLRKIARVHRGIATGANQFFTLSEAEAKENKIEHQFLKPVIANSRATPNYNFTDGDFSNLLHNGYKTWLLSCDKPKSDLKSHAGLLSYLTSGEKKEINKRYLTRTRELWYAQEKRTPAPIVFTYMSREKPRFVYNEANALTLNTLHIIQPTRSIADDERQLKALLCYLNSEICRNLLRRTGRVYGGGLVKLEPREVENLPVIDIENVSEEDISLLSSLFDELCQASREGRENEIADKIVRAVNSAISHSVPASKQMTL